MEHAQSFEALRIKCVWSFNFIFIVTQMIQAQVKFINTLLLGTILMWFMFLLKCQSPFLNDFETFIELFNATFIDPNKKHRGKASYGNPFHLVTWYHFLWECF
jgi:hypothetical protein